MNPKIKKILQKSKQDAVFFGEHFLKNVKMENYKLEPQQKLFLRDTSPYKILFCSRRSGKTLTMIIDLLHKAFFRPNQQIALIAPTLEQSKTFANVFNDMVLRSSALQSSFITQNKLDKQLQNGSRIAFKTAGAASGKKEDSNLVGSGLNTLYIDEAQSMDADAMATILPVVTGQIGQAEIVLAGTPRSRAGFFFENIKNAKQISECYIDNGKPKPCPSNGRYSLHRFKITDLDENDKVMYSRAEYRLTIDELETIKSTIGVEKFRREFCLEFLDSISMPFYSDLIEMCSVCKEPKLFSDYQRPAVFGVDFGKRRNNSVLTVATQTPQGDWEAKYFKYWQLGTRYTDILHYLNVILPTQFPKLQWGCIDATGVGQALAEQVNHNSFYEVDDIIFSQPQKVNLVENTVNNMENQYVKIFPHKKLLKEMSEYTREVTENDRTVFKKGESDDFVDSFMLCNLAITKYISEGGKRTRPFKSYSLGTNILGDKTYIKNRRGKYTKRRNKI